MRGLAKPEVEGQVNSCQKGLIPGETEGKRENWIGVI